MLVRGPDPLETLPRSIRRPPLFKIGRWVASRLSEGGDKPGGTRLEVVMWLPVDDGGGELPTWAQVASTLGRPQSLGPLTIPRAALQALAPEVVTDAEPETERVTVTGNVYPTRSFEGHGSTMARSVRLAGGLLVTLSTT